MNISSDAGTNDGGLVSQERLLAFEHDLRNLTAAMQSAVDVIRLDDSLSADSLSMLSVLDRQLGGLIRLVRDYSQRSSDDSGAVCETPSPRVDLSSQTNRLTEVLVVDDTRIVSYAMQVMLEKLGFSVRTAASGAAALEAIGKKFPDLVFSDIGMAEIDGYALAKRIREISHGRDVRLVALTGSSMQDAERLSIEAGFDEHIAKPMSYATLVQVLKRARLAD